MKRSFRARCAATSLQGGLLQDAAEALDQIPSDLDRGSTFGAGKSQQGGGPSVFEMGMGQNNTTRKNRRLQSFLPFTRVPFGVPVFDSQPDCFQGKPEVFGMPIHAAALHPPCSRG